MQKEKKKKKISVKFRDFKIFLKSKFKYLLTFNTYILIIM